jgi:hypothetical protein
MAGREALAEALGGAVGDLFEVVPALTAEIHKIRGQGMHAHLS